MPRSKQPQDLSNPELPDVSPVDAQIEDSVESTEQPPKAQPVSVTKLEDGRTIEDY